MSEFLDLEDLLNLAADLGVDQLRDIGLLDSAAKRASSTLFGQYCYPTVFDQAAALLESVTRNQALFDGNKRLGWLSTVVFLRINGFEVVMDDDRAYDYVISVATGQLPLPDSAETLRQSSRQIDG